jgi:GNAT superfamily N-acetyltransferase
MIQYKAALPDEYPIAAALRRTMSVEMGHDYDVTSPGWRERFVSYFRGRQAAGEAQLFLALDGGDPIGMVIVSLDRGYRLASFGARVALVNGTFVLPQYRRRGIAQRLMELALEWARAHKCSKARLRTSDAGRLLYESIGFTPTTEMQMQL